jgi:hypothetical protein
MSKGRTRALLLLAALASLAPTPGDIGGCGATVHALDAPLFFDAKRAIDCLGCERCSIETRACRLACRPGPAADAGVPSFAEHCYPLLHDGEVCLRALKAASCTEYRGYMADFAPEVPTECNFCPAESSP